MISHCVQAAGAARRGAPLLLAALLAASLPPGQALAHAHLEASRPAAGATVAASPQAIEIDFSEGVVPRFSGIALRDAAGKPVAIGKPATGKTSATLVVPVGAPLVAGTYTVTWHAVSVDSHRTQGSYRFTVGR